LCSPLYIRRSRRTRYALRNRLVPLVLIDAGPAPARPWLPMAISAVVVVMAIVVLALRSG